MTAKRGPARVVRISREAHPYRTELTPVELPAPERLRVPRQDRGRARRSPLYLSAVRGAGQPAGLRPARARPPAPRSGGHHRPQHAGHAGGALRRARRRPGAGPHQRAARTATRSGTSCSTPGRRSCWSTTSSRRVVKPLDLAALRVIRIDDTGAPGDPYEDFLAQASPEPGEPWLEDEFETISINYTSGTTGRPKGVMIHHRGAYLNAIGETIEIGMTFDARYMWTLPMFHCNGWCYTWGVTALGGTHVCLRRVEPSRIWDLIDREGVTHYCGAPTVQIGIVNDPKAHASRSRSRRRWRGRRPRRPCSRECESWAFGLCTSTVSPRRTALTPSAPGTASGTSSPSEEQARLAARQGQGFVLADLVRVVDERDERRAPGRRDARRSRHARQQRHEGVLRAARGHHRGLPGRLVPLRGHRGVAPRRLHRAARPQEGHHHLGRARTSRPSRSSSVWPGIPP